MKKISRSNWRIYRICSPSISKQSGTQHSVMTFKPSRSARENAVYADNHGLCVEEVSFLLPQAQNNAKVLTSRKSIENSRSFERLLLEAVDEALSSLVDSTKQSIYFYLEKIFGINRKDIPYKIDEFAKAIEKIFGFGAKFVEIQIMKNLYEKIGNHFEYLPEQDDLVFTEYVKAARSHSR